MRSLTPMALAGRRLLCATVAFALMFGQSPVQAQSNKAYDELQSRIDRTNKRVEDLQQSLAEAQAGAKVFQELLQNNLAQITSLRSAVLYAGPGRENARNDAQKSLGAIDNGKIIDSVAALPQSSFDNPELKTQILGCVKGLTDASRQTLSSGSTNIDGLSAACPDVKARQVLRELQKETQAAKQAWTKCRQTVVDATNLPSNALPDDPEGLSNLSASQVQQNLAALAGTAGSAQQCAKDMQQAFQKITDQAKASAALGSALTLASQVCFASGGNPYVCGGMIVIALLMDMFGGKGGGGDGAGPGPNEPGGGGGGKTIDVATVPGPPGPPGPSPSPSPNPSGVFDGASEGTWGGSVTGTIACVAVNHTLTCWTPKDVPVDRASTKIAIDPRKSDAPPNNPPHLAEVLDQTISNGPASNLIICASQDLKVVIGLLLQVPADKATYPIQMELIHGDTSPTLYYPSQSRAISNESHEAQCSKAFR
jgi:predicted  nucleic acid-binding Zn-ribbon protein